MIHIHCCFVLKINRRTYLGLTACPERKLFDPTVLLRVKGKQNKQARNSLIALVMFFKKRYCCFQICILREPFDSCFCPVPQDFPNKARNSNMKNVPKLNVANFSLQMSDKYTLYHGHKICANLHDPIFLTIDKFGV